MLRNHKNLKANKVNVAVNAIKAVKTAEIIGVATIMAPVNTAIGMVAGAAIGAKRGACWVFDKEVSMINDLWGTENIESE